MRVSAKGAAVLALLAVLAAAQLVAAYWPGWRHWVPWSPLANTSMPAAPQPPRPMPWMHPCRCPRHGWAGWGAGWPAAAPVPPWASTVTVNGSVRVDAVLPRALLGLLAPDNTLVLVRLPPVLVDPSGQLVYSWQLLQTLQPGATVEVYGAGFTAPSGLLVVHPYQITVNGETYRTPWSLWAATTATP